MVRFSKDPMGLQTLLENLYIHLNEAYELIHVPERRNYMCSKTVEHKLNMVQKL